MNSLKASVMAETLVIGPCQSCQRQLQRKTEIVTCKNGGHQACATCTQQNDGVCTNCATVAATKFDQGYLEKLNLPQLRQIMRAIGMPVKNDGFQTQPMIDAILEYKSNPAAAQAKWAKSGAINTQSAMFIKKGAPRTNIIIISESDKSATPSLKTPTTPKSPGSRSPLSPSTTNGEFATTSPTTTSPRKTSVNVGNYYERQKSNDMPETPKGSVSQLRQSFENAANANNNKAAEYSRSTSNSGKKLAPTSPTVIESVKTEEKIENEDVIDASINGHHEKEEEEEPQRHYDDDVNNDDQSDPAEDQSPADHQSEYEREEEQPSYQEEVEQQEEIEDEVVENREIEDEVEEHHEIEDEVVEHHEIEEEVEQNHEIEDNDVETVADAVEEIEEEVNANQNEQEEDTIAETADKVEDEE